ncbi:magnesium transporter [Thermotomaculum hydrothermale]|uniref:Magnesium transporter MgtE n=1 Tax=Thermotomaculum hydrothermale TaxID=981385 RepID=A0A7R6PGD3_9BACT|nr:magnesium transporter [Thermotomaculum hydrothermale]BBB33258.1 magnesium transporter [Thermotomaculum hydrothermale]
MNSKILLLAESIRKFLRRNMVPNLKNLINKAHPSDIAAAIEILKPFNREKLFKFMIEHNIEKAAEVLIELEEHLIKSILDLFDDETTAAILKLLSTDDAVAILDYIDDEEKKEKILQLIHDSEKVEEQLLYQDETAGRIMTTDFFSLNHNLTVKEAIEKLHQLEEKAEMVFYLYLVDDNQRLTGVMSLRQLLLSNPDAKLKEVMQKDIISVRVDTDQEEVARLVSQYDLLAIPVVDHDGKLVGIITVDDVIDIIKEEAAEDIYRLAGTSEEEILYKGHPFKIAKIRLPWLLPAFAGTFVVASLLDLISVKFSYFAIFVVFMPMINAAAGNIGIQSSTIMARELAVNEMEGSIWKEVFSTQFRVGVIIGILYALIAFTFSFILAKPVHLPKLIVSISVGIAMFIAIIISSVYGSFLPIFLKKMGVDPAVATGPFVAASNDILGTIIYFSVAYNIVHLLQ